MDSERTGAQAPTSPIDRSLRRPSTGRDAWTDIAPGVVVIPLGACEQHGPHLPLDTDTVIAAELARRLGARLGERREPVAAMIAPSITIGASGEHHRFAGTLSIGTAVLSEMIVEIVRSADWADAVVIVNAHGGNADALRVAAEVLAGSTPPLVVWSPRRSVIPDAPETIAGAITLEADLHAGSIETSVMLAIDPRAVHLERIGSDHEPVTTTVAALRRHGVAAVSPTGILGDPRHVDADWGARILDAWVDDLERSIDDQLPPSATAPR